MALRKDEFDKRNERARAMENKQQLTQQDYISIEINRALFYRIKAVASRKHITINQYLEQLLDEMVPEIDEITRTSYPRNQESLERLQELREELFRRNNDQYLGNSVEDLRQIREERLQQLIGENGSNE